MDDDKIVNNLDIIPVDLHGDNKKDSSNSSIKSFFKKIGSIILKWLKASFKWIVLGLVSLLFAIFVKKNIKFVQDNDTTNKQNAKNDANETKEKINESITAINNIKTDVESIKEDVKIDKENIEINKETYTNKQKETAELAGFTKD